MTQQKHEKNGSTAALIAVLVLIWSPGMMSAAPVISVDMDPNTPGIQETLTVAPSTTFTVDVVIQDNGEPTTPTTFDTIILEAFFNHAGLTLGKGPTLASGLVTSGELAGSSATTIDLFTPAVPAGATLGTGLSSPPGGFANGSGAVGLADPEDFVIDAGSTSTVFSVDFTASAVGTSQIGVGGAGPSESPPLALDGLAATPAVFRAGTVLVTTDVFSPEGGLDVDGHGQSDALTDGILILRFLFQFMGDPLTDGGVVAPGCQRCSPEEIKSFLEGVTLDLDGNGRSDALTDGILILRFLFGFTGGTLTDNAVAPDCTRCTAPAIVAFLQAGVSP